jgi:hypothetical protein
MAGRVDKTGSGPGRTGGLFGHTFARPVACRSQYSFTGPTGQFMDTNGSSRSVGQTP